MQQRLWLAFAIATGVALALQVLWPVDWTDRPETSFDTAPRGHAGVFALLDRFAATRGRWLTGLEMPAAEEAIWWIAPRGVCEPRHDALEMADGGTHAANRETGGDPDAHGDSDRDDDSDSNSEPSARSEPELARPSGPFRHTALPWIEAGGTAVVWLSHPAAPPPPASAAGEAGSDADGEAEQGADAGAARDEDAESGDRAAEGEASDADRAARARAEWEEEMAAHRRRLRDGEPAACPAIAGFPLPARRLAGLEGGDEPLEGRYSPVAFSLARPLPDAERDARSEGSATKGVEGFAALALDSSGARTLPGPTLGVFEWPAPDAAGDEGWRQIWLDAGTGAPFALARQVGEGQLVVAADARVLTNARLARADSAPFVFDWVREFGAPWIDERAHGVVRETGTFRYLAASPAAPVGLALLCLGALVVWRGHAWPARQVEETRPDAPTLATFVDSLAKLYAGTRDHAQVFERYRALSLSRIRRALGLSPGTPGETVLAVLRARGEHWPALREAGLSHLLTKQIPIHSAEDLDRNAGRLDDLVRMIREVGRTATAGSPRRSNPSRRSGRPVAEGSSGSQPKGSK